MPSSPNRYCPVCNKHYYVCTGCGDRGTWKSVCDTPQHYQLYVTIVEFLRGDISLVQAKAYLKNIGITTDNAFEFIPDIQNTIRKILFEEATVETKSKKFQKSKIVKIESNDGELHSK